MHTEEKLRFLHYPEAAFLSLWDSGSNIMLDSTVLPESVQGQALNRNFYFILQRSPRVPLSADAGQG